MTISLLSVNQKVSGYWKQHQDMAYSSRKTIKYLFLLFCLLASPVLAREEQGGGRDISSTAVFLKFLKVCASGTADEIQAALNNSGLSPEKPSDLRQKQSPLLAAALHNPDPWAIDVLIAAGFEITAVDGDGRGVLHHVFKSWSRPPEGAERAVRLLVKAGADPNQRDSLEQTPLHIFAKSALQPRNEEEAESMLRTLRTLISAGADLEARDWQGKTQHVTMENGTDAPFGLRFQRGRQVQPNHAHDPGPFYF